MGLAQRGALDNCLPLLLPCRRDKYVAAGRRRDGPEVAILACQTSGLFERERAWPIFSARVADRVHINTCETGKPQLWQSLLARAPSSSSPAAASAPLHGKKEKKTLASAETRSLPPSCPRGCLCGGMTFTSSAANFARAGLWQCARLPATQHWSR